MNTQARLGTRAPKAKMRVHTQGEHAGRLQLPRASMAGAAALGLCANTHQPTAGLQQPAPGCSELATVAMVFTARHQRHRRCEGPRVYGDLRFERIGKHLGVLALYKRQIRGARTKVAHANVRHGGSCVSFWVFG